MMPACGLTTILGLIDSDVCLSLFTPFRDFADVRNLCISGHSAGAHLAALTVIEHPQLFTSYIGLSGVYDVRDHFGFEHQRAVEQASAMEPAMGGASEFLDFSPLYTIQKKNMECFSHIRFSLAHGVEDDVVPISQSEIFASQLKELGFKIEFTALNNCSHAQIVFDLMSSKPQKSIAGKVLEIFRSQ
eukprot:TRINITY_DN25899_c0_g1_i4.p1 TRINITY_DN25899_c0_g1~~TRINITY_DN25899_c0_g1_i4.p1  ORF type:complete len:188 (-),score=46.22 TRINITY_DN25899_c0_g1_i4:366-929(-)